MERIDYLLEVKILNYDMEYVHFEALDLTTGKKYVQCFPGWIYRFSKDYINEHTLFIKPPDSWRVCGSYSIGGLYFRDAKVFYHPTPGEQAYIDAINS